MGSKGFILHTDISQSVLVEAAGMHIFLMLDRNFYMTMNLRLFVARATTRADDKVNNLKC